MNIRYCHLHSVDENLGLTQLGWDSSWSFPCQVMWSFSLQCRCLQEIVGVNKSAMHIGGTRIVLWTLLFTYTLIYTFLNWQQGEHVLAALSYPSFSTSTLKLKAASERKIGYGNESWGLPQRKSVLFWKQYLFHCVCGAWCGMCVCACMSVCLRCNFSGVCLCLRSHCGPVVVGLAYGHFPWVTNSFLYCIRRL